MVAANCCTLGDELPQVPVVWEFDEKCNAEHNLKVMIYWVIAVFILWIGACLGILIFFKALPAARE